MQVSVETTSGLQRRMTVTVPEEKIDQAVESRLKNLARTVKIQGFRPGKVPFKVVKQRYEGQVRDEVVSEVMQSSFIEAVGQEKLRPAGSPEIDAKPVTPGQGLEYTATFEVYPEISVASLEGVEIKTPTCEVSEADIDHMLDTIRKQHQEWEAVERAAADGDQVTIDFTGTIDGEPFQGNQGNDVPIVLGQGRMIAGFEEGLTGAKTGEERTLDVTFPEDYRATELAGKTAQFAVTVKSVEAPKLPEVDEAFAKRLGVASGKVEDLRAEVRTNMEREVAQAQKSKAKQAVMDKMLEINSLEVPQALVDNEAKVLAKQMTDNLARQGANPADLKLDPAAFDEQARRRVTLGLILAEIVNQQNLSADAARVRKTIEDMASAYEHPDEVVKWYYADKSRLSEVESIVLEEQVVEWALGQAKVVDEPLSFQQLMYPESQQEPA